MTIALDCQVTQKKTCVSVTSHARSPCGTTWHKSCVQVKRLRNQRMCAGPEKITNPKTISQVCRYDVVFFVASPQVEPEVIVPCELKANSPSGGLRSHQVVV